MLRAYPIQASLFHRTREIRNGDDRNIRRLRVLKSTDARGLGGINRGQGFT